MNPLLRIDILSAVPEQIEPYLSFSIPGIAQVKGLVNIKVHNLHHYTDDNYGRIDDYPFGGGAGMLIKCEPIFNCVNKLKSERDYDEVIFLTPDAKRLEQSDCNALSLSSNLIIIAGHYKGIDQRIRENLVTKEYSIGDYVLSGGELPALVMSDAIIRLLPGVIGDSESALEDSFQDGLLESPQYTRPAIYEGWAVPDVLLSGNHKKISDWKMEQAIAKTQKLRPDLL